MACVSWFDGANCSYWYRGLAGRFEASGTVTGGTENIVGLVVL